MEVIIKSFKVCGLNLPIDGSENHPIHYFKEGQTCENVMFKEQLLVRHELLINRNPFLTESDVEDAAENFLLVDQSDSKDDFIDI